MGIIHFISKAIWPTYDKIENYENYYDQPLYDSTKWGSSGGGEKFHGGLSQSGSPRYYDNKTRKINAKTAYYESSPGRAIVKSKVNTVIDSGLKFRSKPMAKVLGITDESASEISMNITDRFHLYMKSKTMTSSGTMNGYQLQRHLFLQQLKNGEYFTKFNRKEIHKNKQLSILTVQTIDDLQIAGQGIFTTDGFGEIDTDKGIIRDEYCREVGYNVVYKEKKDGSYQETNKYIPAYLDNGWISMIHGFTQEEINQGRGVPDLATVLQELALLLDLDLSHIQKALAQSQLAFAVESTGTESGVNFLKNYGVGQESVALDADNSDGENTTSDSYGNSLTYRQMPEAQMQIPGAVGVFGLPANQKVNMLANNAPIAGYGEFVDSFLSHLSASCDTSIEVMRMKFGQNYSASMATLILAWRIANIYRQEFISDFLDRLLESWLELEIASGRISLPGFSDPVLKLAWCNGTWIGSSVPIIDPLKAAKANKENLTMSACTLDDVAMENNGSDGTINRRENKRQFAELPDDPWEKQNVQSTFQNKKVGK